MFPTVKMVSQNMTAGDITDKDAFYSVLADSDIQPCLFEPEWVWGVGCQKLQLTTSTLIGHPHKTWRNFPFFDSISVSVHCEMWM